MGRSGRLRQAGVLCNSTLMFSAVYCSEKGPPAIVMKERCSVNALMEMQPNTFGVLDLTEIEAVVLMLLAVLDGVKTHSRCCVLSSI